MAQPTIVELVGVPVGGRPGKRFPLAGPEAGELGVVLGTELAGFYDAPVTTLWIENAHEVGARPAGYKVNKRELTFGLITAADGGESWEFNDSELRKALAYDRDSRIYIETENSRRWLDFRLAKEPSVTLDTDVHQDEIARVTISAIAGDPWWYEPDVTPEPWVATTDTTATDGAGEYITSETGYVTISNPCDVEIFLQWTIQAPGIWTIPDFSFGSDVHGRAVEDANRRIVMPELWPGEHIVVDTNPMHEQVASSIDSEVWARMGGQSFQYSIPPYTLPTQLPVTVTGAPAGVGIQVRMRRNWSRPWGLK